MSRSASVLQFIAMLLFLLPNNSFGDASPLCDNLSRFSCAPGSYKDQTGVVKSASEIQRFMSNYVEKTRIRLNGKFKKILDDPQNSYFKDLALSGLGLKNSPQCTSSIESDQAACLGNLIDGLTTLAQKQTLSPLMPSASLTRMSNLSDADFILQNENYQRVINELNAQAQTDLSNPEMEKQIKNKIFPQIQALIVDRIDQLSIPDKTKKYMENKVKSIQYAGSNCTEPNSHSNGSGDNGPSVSSLLIPNAFYYPGRNTFKFCAGMLLQSSSEFDIAMKIGHELSHSIDPCQIAFGPPDLGFKYKSQGNLKKMESEFPLPNVLSCLRSAKSVGARNLIKRGILSEDKAELKQDFCQQDQIIESFADWMGAEVLPKYIEQNYKLTAEQFRDGYANARRALCWTYRDMSDNFNYDSHPAIGKRIDRILLVNPQIRKQMGCKPNLEGVAYCDPDKLPSDEQSEGTAPIEPRGTDGTGSSR